MLTVPDPTPEERAKLARTKRRIAIGMVVLGLAFAGLAARGALHPTGTANDRTFMMSWWLIMAVAYFGIGVAGLVRARQQRSS